MELHPKSFVEKVRDFESPFLVYHLKLKSSCIYIHDATMVYPMPLLFFGERLDIIEEGKGLYSIRVDDMIKFSCFKKTGLLVKVIFKKFSHDLSVKLIIYFSPEIKKSSRLDT